MYESKRVPYGPSPILRYFEFEHLPDDLRAVSRHFAVLAKWVDDELSAGAEKSTALRKLLEAKDAAVRAALETRGGVDEEVDEDQLSETARKAAHGR